MLFALCPWCSAVFISEFPLAPHALRLKDNAMLYALCVPLKMANFFMDDNLLRFLKYDIARPDPHPYYSVIGRFFLPMPKRLRDPES
jgi:hypothetical protein